MDLARHIQQAMCQLQVQGIIVQTKGAMLLVLLLVEGLGIIQLLVRISGMTMVLVMRMLGMSITMLTSRAMAIKAVDPFRLVRVV
jgi:hypothetical protein